MGSGIFSDSMLMYLPGFDDAYEKVQDDETPYNELVTTPEKLYLQQISSNIVMELPENFNYIDLGPELNIKNVLFLKQQVMLVKFHISPCRY